ncbi:DENN domain-containing protein 5A [Loa loa]|uniref:DENN domain-containing protein 5A n=1 Tax=Loa loa TaxID=7209 RepID=A0A1S0ULH4_LOALO|nr:DENN domain-containing protein 5A [Loa loa]EJD76429.1 DENN domain-containing protein 5A [Loa loa]
MTSNVSPEATATIAQASSASDLTLVDYFVLVGHDNNALLQAVISIEPSGTNNSDATELLYVPPLERSYVASVLHHFPERRSAYSFPSEIVSLCLPKGLKFHTQNDIPSPAMHTFANIREDGSRINGCALIYHEEVRDVGLCEHMSQLHTEHVRALTAREKATERAHVPPGTVSGGTHTLPRGNRKNRAKRTSYYDSGSSRLYVAKCICLISRIPFVSAGEHLLTALHSFFTSEVQPPPLPLESYIYWILNEVPLPAPGSTLKICLDRIDIVLQRPGPNELPFFDHSLSSLFDLLTVDKFLRLFTCFLLEHQILLCSRSFQRLMLVAESLCSLAFPFRWQLTYVPILPYSQLKFMEAPVPFVMGLCYEDTISEQIFQGNMCVLDIDSGVLNMPEDVPALPDRTEFAKEVASVLMRYEEQSAVLNGEVMRRQIGATGKDWYKKRMSRSFDGETLPSMLEEDNSSRRIVSRKDLAPLPFDDVLKQSEVLARVTAIAHRAGVSIPFENIQKELQSNDFCTNSPVCREYFKDMKINNAVREVFINRFAWLLYSYEHFVINTSCPDLETYFASRESVTNFDKATFLSDQPSKNLPFLAAFLETQMFTSFIDAKIVSQWKTADENLQIFDSRIQTLRTKYGLQMVRTPTYEKAPRSFDTEEMITKREEALDYIVPLPHELPGTSAIAYDGTFPELNEAVLEGSFVRSPVPSPWKQRHRRLRPKLLESIIVDGNTTNKQSSCKSDTPRQIAHQNWKFVEQLLKETKSKTKRMLVEKMGREALQLGHSDAIVNGLEENTLVASFCDLLERIWAHGSVKKQGKSSLWAHILHHQEIEKLGILSRGSTRRNSALTPGIVEIKHESHNEQEYMKQEKKTFVSVMDEDSVDELARNIRQQCIDDPHAPAWSLPILRAANFICDKLSSNVNNNVEYSNWKLPARTAGLSSSAVVFGRSRSPQKTSRKGAILHRASSFSDFAPYWTTAGNNLNENVTDSSRKRSSSRGGSPDIRQFLAPLPMHIAYDLKNVLRMTDIKTDIGYARAFVRLALERKLLHKHLKTVLGNTHLLQQLYKRYAFLRCDDEKEQFLYHVLSLNAAEFNCFTNSFKKTKMQYHVLLVSRNSRSIISWPVWIIITGSLCSTTAIELKQGILDFTFDYRNLGMLSTLRIGHGNLNVSNGASPKWFLDYVLVRNEITGQSYRFNCGRWFGKGIDDGSLERLLVAEKEPQIAPNEVLVEECSSERVIKASSKSRTPPRSRSPSTSRSETWSRVHLTEIQQQLGEAVNALVKYFYTSAEGGSRGELTQLLCAPGKGFVSVMVVVFMYGRQDSIWSARLFRSHYPWDYIEKVCVWFWDLIHMEDTKRLTREQHSLIIQACRLVRRISSNIFLGKDGKFQLFILITVRDHILSGLLPLMAWTPITSQMNNHFK